MNKNFFRASAEDFKKIPGSPVAYWVSDAIRNSFDGDIVESVTVSDGQNKTGDNDKFVRMCWEISARDVGRDLKWLFYAKGGGFRKWAGNLLSVVNWSKEAQVHYHKDRICRIIPEYLWYKDGITWGLITSGSPSFRYLPEDATFDVGGSSVFFNSDSDLWYVMALLNTNVAIGFLKLSNPTINFQVKNIRDLPYKIVPSREVVENLAHKLYLLSKNDWDAYETSWDFAINPLVAMASNPVNPVNPVEKLYADLREKWARDCEEMRRLETENNRIFIEAYGLQDELTPEVPWHEITLTCNPFYRYGAKSAEYGVQSAELPRVAELEERLKGDTAKELVSYAVGCMMGRYSLEKPGLILADQGSKIEDYWEKLGIRNEELGIGSGVFEPDEDGIIPVLDNDWFEDDIVTRFKAFIKVAFGEEHFFENMAWIEEALGKDIRSYFTKDFYKDHLQRYQNRPIYWLFQSPKGAFRALVYMHRYKPDMVGGVLGYLRSLQTKVDNQLDVAMQVGADESKSASERVRANKDAVKYAKAKKELDEYEKNVLYPLSTERIEIDLDDGVKVNYKKFGVALRKVAALEGKGE